MLTKFVNGSEVGGEMDTSEVRATLWEDLRRKSGLAGTWTLEWSHVPEKT